MDARRSAAVSDVNFIRNAIPSESLTTFSFSFILFALSSHRNIRGLADIDDSVPFQSKITNVRETRLTTIIMNIMIYFTLYSSLLLGHIPTPVLDGLFLYCAIQTVYRGAV